MKEFEKLALIIVLLLGAACITSGWMLTNKTEQYREEQAKVKVLQMVITAERQFATDKDELLKSVIAACLKGTFFQAGNRIYFCADKNTIQQLKQFNKPQF